MAPMTLRGVERGAAGATIGAYVAVLQVLGLESALALLAKSDEVGRELQDAQLPSRPRPRRVAGGGRASSAKKHEAPHDAPSKAQSKAPSWAAAAGFVTSEELARARSAPHPSTHTDEDEQE